MVKGTQRAERTEASKYVGFTTVQVKAINPTRSELNKLLDKEDSDEDKPLEYLGEDKDGNKRLRLVFWLHDAKLDKYFPYSFNLTDKERQNKNEDKNQYINNVCQTAWADDEANLPKFFTHFLDKNKEELGSKTYRKALSGEEELGTLLKTWLGRLNFSDPESSVDIDTKALFDENYTDLRGLIESDYDSPFVILLGVRTDVNDPTKQYQQVYGKGFLPAGFMTYINKGMKFPSDYSKKVWAKFEEDATGEYGFDSYFELEPLKEYNRDEDPAAGGTALEKEDVTPVNSKF